MLDDRKLDVLRAIVEDYVSTNEPVGSKVLVERHQLGVSPATIRNDMGALEDEGYITQPHTSAGRVPTDKGYRLFVDKLSTVKPLTPAERRAIEEFLRGAVDLDDVVNRSVRLLAQLTRQVAVVQYPSLSRSAVRHLEIVRLAETRLMVVLITDTGRVEQRVVELPSSLSEDEVADLRTTFNARIAGRPLADAADAHDRPAGDRRRLMPGPTSSPSCRPSSRPWSSGSTSASCWPAPPTSPAAARWTSRARSGRCSRRSRSTSCCCGCSARRAIRRRSTSASAARTPHEGLQTASVVTTGYGADAATALASLGVLGPTRMDYPGAMGAVRAVARYVGQILAEA